MEGNKNGKYKHKKHEFWLSNEVNLRLFHSAIMRDAISAGIQPDRHYHCQ